MSIRSLYGWPGLIGVSILFDWTHCFGATNKNNWQQKQANIARTRWRPELLQSSFKDGFAFATWGFA